MSSETWKSIQEHKRKQDHLRERIQKRRRDRQAVNENVQSEVPMTFSDPDAINSSSAKLVTSVDPQVEKLLQQYLCSFSHEFPLTSQAILNGMQEHMTVLYPNVKLLSIEEVEFVLQKQAAQQFL